MSPLDPSGAAMIELILDVYDRLLSKEVEERRTVFRQACRDVRLAVVATGRVSPDACSDLLSAIGERAGVSNARQIVRAENRSIKLLSGEAIH